MMKKQIVSILVIVALLLTTVCSVTFAQENITLDFIPDKHVGESVTLSGDTSMVGSINIKVIFEDDTIIYADEAKIINGVFTREFAIGGGWSLGSYTVVAGNKDTVATIQFHVISLKSLAAPSKLTAKSVSSSQIDLKWIVSEGDNVLGYKIFRNGSEKPIGIAEGANTTIYSDKGLAASTTYIYTVKAYDAEGNMSEASKQASTTTKEQDTTITPDPGSEPEAETPTAAYSDGSKSRTKLSALQKTIDELSKLSYDKRNINQIIKKALDLINEAANELKDEKDLNIVLNQTCNIINSVVSLTKKIETSDEEAISICAALTNLAEQVMEKVNTESIKPSDAVTDNKAIIEQHLANMLIEKLNDIAKVSDSLNEALKSAGVHAGIKPVLNIQVAFGSSVNQISIDIAGSLLLAAVEKNISMVVINTNVATISVIPDSINIKNTDTVSLSAEKLEKDGLSADIKSIVGNNDVYDFNFMVDGAIISNFSKPIQISIPYILKADEDPDRITVFFINDESKIVNVQGKYDDKTKTVKFFTRHFSKYMIQENIVSFKDVQQDYWARKHIESIASKGIILGVGDGNYKPDAKVTKAEFATMIVRTFNIFDENSKSSFSDVKETDWYYKYVSTALKYNLISDKPIKKYKPEEAITRQDMAVITGNALFKLNGINRSDNPDIILSKFKDAKKISISAKDSVALLLKENILTGYTDGTFGPKSYLTRAEAAAIIYRIFMFD